jgi:hypothetical protein
MGPLKDYVVQMQTALADSTNTTATEAVLIVNNNIPPQDIHSDHEHSLARLSSSPFHKTPSIRNFPTCAVLIALQENTHLYVIPKSHLYPLKDNLDAHHQIFEHNNAYLKPDDLVLITIPPYHALLFNTSLLHAGADYSSPNIRVHFYLDTPRTIRNGSLTYPAQRYFGKNANKYRTAIKRLINNKKQSIKLSSKSNKIKSTLNLKIGHNLDDYKANLRLLKDRHILHSSIMKTALTSKEKDQILRWN